MMTFGNKMFKTVTPVDVVKRRNPLICKIAETSEKWHKRWPDIEQPWPVEGTFNSDEYREASCTDGEEHRRDRELMAQINDSYSHVTPVNTPPSYEMAASSTTAYPELPMICQDGGYRIQDDEERIWKLVRPRQR